MKTVETLYNPNKRVGEQSPGKIYSDKLKVRARREWRGVKDTFYDYTRWLYLMSVLGRFIMVPRNVKGFFRYRWMMSYLFVPHGMDKVYGRKQYVADLAKEYGVDGIIYQQVKFCDPWAYERVLGSHMLQEDYGYPVLSVDRPYNIASSSGQMRTRIQAFVESIEIKNIQKGGK